MFQGEGGGAVGWTPERVAANLIEAFRLLPGLPIYSPWRGELRPVLPGQDLAPLDLVTRSERVLGRASPERRALLVWARAKATNGEVGGSVRAYCAETGTNSRTFDRRWRRACQRLADALNADAPA